MLHLCEVRRGAAVGRCQVRLVAAYRRRRSVSRLIIRLALVDDVALIFTTPASQNPSGLAAGGVLETQARSNDNGQGALQMKTSGREEEQQAARDLKESVCSSSGLRTLKIGVIRGGPLEPCQTSALLYRVWERWAGKQDGTGWGGYGGPLSVGD
jgi:hypothetical protein